MYVLRGLTDLWVTLYLLDRMKILKNANAGAAERKFDGEAVILWQEFFSESGETYYYNPSTQESSWDYPQGPGVQVVSQYQDDDGNFYWYNFVTGESEWA